MLMHDVKAKCMYVSKVYGNVHCTHTYKEINQFMCIELLKYIKLKKNIERNQNSCVGLFNFFHISGKTNSMCVKSEFKSEF